MVIFVEQNCLGIRGNCGGGGGGTMYSDKHVQLFDIHMTYHNSVSFLLYPPLVYIHISVPDSAP